VGKELGSEKRWELGKDAKVREWAWLWEVKQG
jgi:hypothetical protein